MQLDLLVPGFAAKTDQFLFGLCSLVLLRDGKRNLLFDSGSFRVRGHLLAALQSRGLSPDQIDAVFLSHLHWDHVENADLFRRAEILVPRLEYEYTSCIAPCDWGTAPFVRDILHDMRLVLLDQREEELFPGIRTLLLPGHSVATQGLAVRVDDDIAVLASDAVWSARDAVHHKPDLAFYNAEMGTASVEKVLATATVIYPGHDRPFRFEDGRVRYLAHNAYRFRFFTQPYGDDLEYAISTDVDKGFGRWPSSH